jgi:hypothetical protein
MSAGEWPPNEIKYRGYTWEREQPGILPVPIRGLALNRRTWRASYTTLAIACRTIATAGLDLTHSAKLTRIRPHTRSGARRMIAALWSSPSELEMLGNGDYSPQ